jgi:hypothetical protein
LLSNQRAQPGAQYGMVSENGVKRGDELGMGRHYECGGGLRRAVEVLGDGRREGLARFQGDAGGLEPEALLLVIELHGADHDGAPEHHAAMGTMMPIIWAEDRSRTIRRGLQSSERRLGSQGEYRRRSLRIQKLWIKIAEPGAAPPNEIDV